MKTMEPGRPGHRAIPVPLIMSDQLNSNCVSVPPEELWSQAPCRAGGSNPSRK